MGPYFKCVTMIWLVLLFTFLILVFLWMHYTYSYWKKRGIPGPAPLPFFGNIGAHMIGRCTLGEAIMKIYKKYDGYPFVGFYRSTHPVLLVRDPELVSRILVKNFQSFRYNEMALPEGSESLFAQNPFILRDQIWKETRQMITPGLTSGRMKTMFSILKVISQNFIKYIENHPTAATDGIETRALTKRLTLDNVAKSAFGIDGKAFESYDDISEFNKLADGFLNPGSTLSLIFVLMQIFPGITNYTERFFQGNTENELKSIISETLKYRKQNNIRANDYLQFLTDQGKEYNWSDNIITSHASTLFIDGYETSSLVLTMLLLNLAQNPVYQEKIREDIHKYEIENHGELTYEAIHEMPWLNACLYESIRCNPPLHFMTKVCAEHFEYTTSNPSFKNLTVKFSPGDKVILPYGYFMGDETYFENPEEFRPERMLSKDKYDKSIFFPFGDGPRACIGQRLGIMQMKLGAASVVKNFQLSVSPKLKQPIKYMPYHFMNEVVGGVWIRYKKITSV